MNERATGSAQAAALELTVTPSFLSCSSHTCPRRGASAGPRRWDSTSFLFTASPPVGLTVRPATSWRTATVEWSTCQVSGRGGQLQDGRTACDLLCIPRPDRKLFTHSMRMQRDAVEGRLLYDSHKCRGEIDGNRGTNQGSILVSRSSQMFGEYSSQCSICLLIICCSSLLEFSVQIFGCLTILASWCGTHSNIQVFIAFIQMFPFLHPNTPSTPSSKASVHAPANECVGTGISIVSPTMHTVIVRGSSLVKRVGSGARRGVGGG